MSLFKKGEIAGGHQIKPRSPAPHQGRVLGQAFGRVSAMFHVKHGQSPGRLTRGSGERPGRANFVAVTTWVVVGGSELAEKGPGLNQAGAERPGGYSRLAHGSAESELGFNWAPRVALDVGDTFRDGLLGS